jgi:hypothetical protein
VLALGCTMHVGRCAEYVGHRRSSHDDCSCMECWDAVAIEERGLLSW